MRKSFTNYTRSMEDHRPLFFLRGQGFIFNTLLILSYSIIYKAKNSFYHYTPPFSELFIQFCFEIGCYYFT